MPSAAQPCSWSPMKSLWRGVAARCCAWPTERFYQEVGPVMNLRLALRFARRELRGGFAGFRIFFFCLVLGSAAISGVESLSDAFLTGLQDQGQVLLGGDVSVNLVHRPAAADELAFLNTRGRVSQAQSMRAMAYAQGNNQRQL